MKNAKAYNIRQLRDEFGAKNAAAIRREMDELGLADNAKAHITAKQAEALRGNRDNPTASTGILKQVAERSEIANR